MAATNMLVAGIYYLWIAFRDSDGYPEGSNTTPNTRTVNTAYHAYRVKHPVSFTPPAPSYETATRRGGMKLVGQRDLGLSDYGVGTIVLDSFDEQFHAYITETSVDTSTMSGWDITTAGDTESARPQLIVGLTIGVTTEAGTDEFMTVIFHNATIRPAKPASSQEGGVNPNPLSYELVPNVSSRTGIGRLYSAMAFNIVENNDTFMLVRHDDPIFVSTYIANGVATTFVLAYRPTSSDATGAANNSITNEGATLAVTSVNTTTGVVTFSAAPTSGNRIIVAFPTRYVAI